MTNAMEPPQSPSPPNRQNQDFRQVHESSAKPIKGRSIVDILYDRSIHGPKGVGGIRRNQDLLLQYSYPYIYNHRSSTGSKIDDDDDDDDDGNKLNDRQRQQNLHLLATTSPSSVIRAGNSDDDGEDDSEEEETMDDNDNGRAVLDSSTDTISNVNTNTNTNTNTRSHHNRHHNRNRDVHNIHSDDMDSLSEVLRDSQSLSDSGPTTLTTTRMQRSDSLSEILDKPNNGSPSSPNDNNNNNNNNNSSINAPTTKLPPRLKMNSYPCNHFTEIRNFAELYTVTKFDWSYLSLRSREDIANHRRSNRNSSSTNNNENIINDTAISTISIAFSPDGKTIASTHGDHTVKITCCNTGALIRNLEGHPRTPWTVKYHPTKSNIVASGCLGFQVRIWDWNYRPLKMKNRRNNSSRYNEDDENKDGDYDNDDDENELDYHLGKGVCLNHIRLQSSIISLSFHPTGSLLAVASGHSLHLWVYDDNARSRFSSNTNSGSDGNDRRRVENGNGPSNNDNSNNQGGNDRNNANTMPTAAAVAAAEATRRGNSQNSPNRSNNTNQSSSIITQIRYDHNLRCVYFPPGGDTIILGGVNPPQFAGDTSYSLRLWDFDLEVALNPQLYLGEEGQLIATNENGERQRDALNNFKTFLPRALLYGDGGFDVSPDGTKLCGCAEYWLPDGVDSAMELIERKEELAWMEEENARLSAANAAASSSMDVDSSPSSRPIVRSPRRKMKRQQNGQEEKRRKETLFTNTGAVPSAENHVNLSSSEDTSGPRTATEGCRTPPNPIRPQVLTSPPLPPGRRWSLQFNRPPQLNRTSQGPNRSTHSNRSSNSNSMPIPLSSGVVQSSSRHTSRHDNSDGPPPPPLPPSHNPNHRPGIRTGGPFGSETSGRFVPHVVVVNLDKSGNLGKLLEATPLGSRATSVTCVKFSPSTEFCLLGYGVREFAPNPHAQQFHPVTALYNVRGGISHVSTMLSSDDDVNIAMFHPNHGQGFVYGTKQGRVKVVSPKPWNHYYE